MANEGKAFTKGGLGCLVLFFIVAAIGLMTGARVHLDIVGVIMLLIIGGVIGLLVNFIYQKGKRDAVQEENKDPKDPT